MVKNVRQLYNNVKLKIIRLSSLRVELLTFCYFGFRRNTRQNRAENVAETCSTRREDRRYTLRRRTLRVALAYSTRGVWPFCTSNRTMKWAKITLFLSCFYPFHESNRAPEIVSLIASKRYKTPEKRGSFWPRHVEGYFARFSEGREKAGCKQTPYFC